MNITSNFIDKYNKPGPRYTSYPPATSFQSGFSIENFTESLVKSNTELPESISIYIHVPFCPQRCYFCGCNTTAFENEETIRKYIDCVLKEMDSVFKFIDKNRKVSQIHWGGGTPNSISFDYLNEVIQKIKSNFSLSSNCEVAIECNPAYLEMEDIDALAKMGFNRISLGIQDFCIDVLEAIHRQPSKYPIEEVVARIRKNNFRGFNIDLVYGLPTQTIDGFKSNIEKAISLSPDRIVTFSYAHVPWFNDLQKNLEKYRMPTPEEKINMLILAINEISAAGYESIGMDHFAKPDDELSIAKSQKNLHRNFQGYCTRETTGQVYAFGASSISQLWSTYIQNVKNLHEYIKRVEKEGLAVEKGLMVADNEIVIREVINEIMCNGFLDFKEIANRFDVSTDKIKEITAFDAQKLEVFIADGLVEFNEEVLRVSSDGMLVVRNVAMVFDPMLSIQDSQFSKTV